MHAWPFRPCTEPLGLKQTQQKREENRRCSAAETGPTRPSALGRISWLPRYLFIYLSGEPVGLVLGRRAALGRTSW